MNVDIDNFSQVRQFILSQNLIEKSDLISFDLQFAGLKFQGNDRDRPQYLPSEKYQKMAAVARKYCIMQVGITFFTTQKQSKELIAYPFNFYIFPRPTIYSDPVVSMQSGCVSFNTANKMDWSRWIQKGITYMKQTQCERINDIAQKARKFQELFEFLEDQIKSIIKSIISQVEKMDKNLSENAIQKKIFQLPSSNFIFTKKVIEKYFQQESKLYAIEETIDEERLNEEELISFAVIKISQEEKQKIQRKKEEELFGFTLLFEKIWSSGKAFVGHNFFFDLLFMYDAFIAALPYDYAFFKKMLTQRKINQNVEGKMIPEQEEVNKRIFYDTKYISTNLSQKLEILQENTSLQGLYKGLMGLKGFQKKQISLAKGFERYELKNQILHEAGFDSYLTGWIFYQLSALSKSYNIDSQEQFKGKINLNRSYFYINLNSTFDGVREHEKVFYIEVVQPKKFMAIQYIKSQRSQVYKTLRQIVKDENIAKDIHIREGLKQVFIEIKSKKNQKEIISILVKYVKLKKIKDLYTLVNYLQAKNAKQWSENLNNKNHSVGNAN